MNRAAWRVGEHTSCPGTASGGPPPAPLRTPLHPCPVALASRRLHMLGRLVA